MFGWQNFFVLLLGCVSGFWLYTLLHIDANVWYRETYRTIIENFGCQLKKSKRVFFFTRLEATSVIELRL